MGRHRTGGEEQNHLAEPNVRPTLQYGSSMPESSVGVKEKDIHCAVYNSLMTSATRAAPQPRTPKSWWLMAPALGLLLYWRVALIWFQNDDFAWLGLDRDARAHGILHALFTPFAEGTVRVLGDRLYFLALFRAFGLHALPFHLVQLTVWAAAVALVGLVGSKLSGSPAAGVIAALFWAANANAISSVAWPAAFQSGRCARRACWRPSTPALRGWRAAEWIFYLAGFGALEITVMYPVLALLYVLAKDRKQARQVIWLFVPAVIFTAVHFLLIPKAGGAYALALDGRLPATISTYFGWTFEPASSALRSHAEQLKAPELLLGMILGVTLGWFPWCGDC